MEVERKENGNMVQYRIHDNKALLLKDENILQWRRRYLRAINKRFIEECWSDRKYNFHYTNQETFVLLRVDRRLRAMEKYLHARDIDFDVEDYPKDNIKIVAKYQEEFEAIFHNLSKLALKAPEKEYGELLERCCHLSSNIMFQSLDEESKFYSKQALGRAKIDGYLAAGGDISKLYKEECGKKTRVNSKNKKS